MKTKVITLALVTCCWACLNQAQAVPITIEITGEVTSASGSGLPGTIYAGVTFTGSYTYDSSTIDSGGGHYVHDAPYGISLSLGGYEFKTALGHIGQFDMLITDNVNLSTDSYSVRSYENVSNPPVGFPISSIRWDLWDNTHTALDSDALPVTAPVLTDWGYNVLRISGSGDLGGLLIEGVVTQEVPEPLVAEIDIKPTTLNLASKGKWITCKIWLPEGYNVNDIDPDTILIERRFKAEWKWFNESRNVVMAKFARSELEEILETGDVELIVSCHLLDGTYFEGTDTIRVIDKGRSHKGRVNSNSKVVDGIEYYIQTDKAVYYLGENVQMLYRVTNLRDEDVTFGLPHSPVWNFWVEKDGEYIRRAVNGWFAIITEFTLSPGESKVFPADDDPWIWNMRDRERNLVSPGKYNVIGGLYNGSGSYDYTKVAVPIRIVPKPAHASPKNK